MKVVVEKLKTGYTVTDESGEVFAYSYPEQVWRKIRDLFGIAPRSSRKKVAVEAIPEVTSPVQVPKSEVSDVIVSDLLIPKFEWDKNKEKHYQKIDFFEGDDGKVMIFYINSKVFTTKEKIMQIPYPIPYRYSQLVTFGSNKRTAIRMYRQYLEEEKYAGAKESESDRKPSPNPPIPFISNEKAMELKEKRQGDTRPPKADKKERRDMVIKMGIQ